MEGCLVALRVSWWVPQTEIREEGVGPVWAAWQRNTCGGRVQVPAEPPARVSLGQASSLCPPGMHPRSWAFAEWQGSPQATSCPSAYSIRFRPVVQRHFPLNFRRPYGLSRDDFT